MAIWAVVVWDDGAGLYGLVTVDYGAPSTAAPSVGSVTPTEDSVVGEGGGLFGILQPRFRDREKVRLVLQQKLV